MASICTTTLTVGVVPGVPALVTCVSVSSDFTVPFGIKFVEVDATSGNVRIKLHPLIKVELNIRRIDAEANIVTVDGDGFNIDGSPTTTILSQLINLRLIGGTTEWGLH